METVSVRRSGILLGCTGVFDAERSHTDELPEKIFHSCVFQEKTDEGGLSMAFLDAVPAGVEDAQWRICVGELYSKRTVIIVLNSKVEGLYWFFPVIIGIYLFMPVMSLLAKTEYKKTLWYLVGFFTAVNATIPLLCNLIGIQWNGFLNSPFNEYYMFIVLGYLLSVTDIKRKWRIPIYLTGIACACIRYAGVYTLSMRDGAKNTLFFSYGQFHSIGLAVAVFVLFKYIPWDRLIHEKGAKILSIISGCSLGIYLIHHQVMGKELNILGIEASSFAWRTAGSY